MALSITPSLSVPSCSSSMDAFEAELNPCSLETLPEPLPLHRQQRNSNKHAAYAWPLVLSCYQLDEAIGYRRGQLNLFQVVVPDITSDAPSLPLKFGAPQVVLDKTSGILDGKWSAALSSSSWGNGDSSSRGHNNRLFATAHAAGEIKLHQLRQASIIDDSTGEQEIGFTLDVVAQSDLPAADEKQGIPPLCLSLNFASNVLHNHDQKDSLPIVSTYSNGQVAVHDVVFLPSDTPGGEYRLVQRVAWKAHSMFNNPAEVWSADFYGNNNSYNNQHHNNNVLSCGDEGKIKLWDLRATQRPVHTLAPFNAGATCASAHPRHEYLLACGSYDETICLLDTRYLVSSKPPSRSQELGGGIWRIKWHPYKDERLLVAAMHGGCRVVGVDNWENVVDNDCDHENDEEDAQFSFHVTKEFCQHESMAYGADWLVCKHPTRNGFFEAAASCSFYDRAVFLWDSC